VRREVVTQTGIQVGVRRLSGVYSEPTIQVMTLPSGEVVHCIVNCFACDMVEAQNEPPVGTLLTFADPSNVPEPFSAQSRRWLTDALSGDVVVW
jgi:hypothetical protein